MVSRLPITIRPAHRELALSYVGRLAALHELPAHELWRQVSRERRLDDDLLAIVANQPIARLRRAIVEMLDPERDWLALRHEAQRGCRRCTAGHPGGPVLQLLGHHDYICTRHKIWIGPPDQLDHPQPSLDELPDIVAAQHRHRRLLRRAGPAATFDAVLTGFLICAHRWNVTTHPNRSTAIAWHAWQQRAEQLIPPGTEATTFSASRLFAATYPEAVRVAELIASLHWRRLAAGDPTDQAQFATAIGHRLGMPHYQPRVSEDPIAHWIEQNSWRPPSPPTFAFHTMKTFRGPVGFRKASKNSDRALNATASWFATNRRAGNTILLHRTINPVIHRDWSDRHELFVGTLTRTAEADPHTTLTTSEESTSNIEGRFFGVWTRPHPQPSTFLDTTTEPVPWTRRDHRPPPVKRIRHTETAT